MDWQRLVVLFLFLISKQPAKAQWKLLYHSQDVAQQQIMSTPSDTINSNTAIESRGVLSKYLIVRYTHTKRKLVAKDDVWGFVDGLGAVWRCYEKELFLVIKKNDNWIEYAVERPVRAWNLRNTRGVIMYSRSLDSNIKSNWSDAMADVAPDYRVGRKNR